MSRRSDANYHRFPSLPCIERLGEIALIGARAKLVANGLRQYTFGEAINKEIQLRLR
jgi:hypothetical protein